MNSRDECFERIKTYMKDTLKLYYGSHLGWLFDERSEEAIKFHLEALDEIRKILECYDIRSRLDDDTIRKRRGSRSER